MTHPNPRFVFTPSPMPVRRGPTPIVHHRSWNQLQTLALLGCGLVAAACALPWVDVQRPSSRLHEAGMALPDGQVVLGLAAAAFLLALFGRFGCGLAALVIAGAAVVAAADITDLQRAVPVSQQDRPLTIGPGLWLVPVGALIAFIGCLLVAFED